MEHATPHAWQAACTDAGATAPGTGPRGRKGESSAMRYYGGMDVPFVDPTLINNYNYGLGNLNYGLTTPFFGTPKMTWGDVNFDTKLEVLPLGGLPYGTPQLGFNPFVNTLINPFFKTATTPFFGL